MWRGEKVILREKKLNDALDDFRWQSDPEMARFDAAPVLTISFPQFLLDYTDDLKFAADTSTRKGFAIDTLDGKHIGNCGFYGIDTVKSQTELGIMIGEKNYWSQGYGMDAINVLLGYICQNTKLQRVYLKTLDWNLRAQKCFEKCGFTRFATLDRDTHHFILMETRCNHKQTGKAK